MCGICLCLKSSCLNVKFKFPDVTSLAALLDQKTSEPCYILNKKVQTLCVLANIKYN